MIKRARATALVLVLATATLPCAAMAQALAVPAAPSSLHERIQSVYNDIPPADVKVELANVQALRDEAAKATDLSPKDRAILEQVYANALSHNEDYIGAAKAVQVSMDIMQKSGITDDAYQAELLQNLATYKSASGDLQAGLAHLQVALALDQKIHGPNSEEVGQIWGSIAYAYSKLGRLSDAIDAYRHSIALTHPGEGSTLAYIGSYDNLGHLLNRTSDIEGALEVNRKALDLAMKLLPEGHRVRGITLNNMAESLLNAGRYSEAESYFRQALDFATVYRGKTSFDTGQFMSNLAACLILEGRPEKAEPLLLTALDILKVAKTSQPEAAGQTEASLARLAFDRGDLDLAQSRYVEGLRLMDVAGTRGHEQTDLYYHLAEVRFAMGDYVGALQAIDKAVPFFEKELPATAHKRTDAEMLKALILSRYGDPRAALSAALIPEQTMETRLHDNQMSRQERIDTAASYRQAFSRFADIAISAGRPDLAFRAAQLAAFSEISATSQALAARTAATTPKAAQLARRVQDDQERRNDLDHARSFAVGRSNTEVVKIDGGIAAIDQDLARLTGQLDSAFPQYERLSRPQASTVEAAQAHLAAHQAVVLPVVGDDRVITLVLTRTGFVWDAHPLLEVKAVGDIAAVRQSIESTLNGGAYHAFARQPAYDLGQAIFTAKALSALKTVKDVQIMSSGPLMTLPFALLLTAPPDGRDDDPAALRASAFLVRRFAISIKPAFLANQTHTTASGQAFAGIGAPVLGPTVSGLAGMPTGSLTRGGMGDVAALRDLPSLPSTAGELTAIDKALNRKGSRLLLGDAATETQIKTLPLRSYGVIAFATHGLISGDLKNLQEPALVLTPPAVATDTDDGLLTASEVAGLRLNASWVILSACNTGSGRESGAAGYSGLTRAFMQAGARSLLVSLWPVRDDVAARLSVDTVTRNARGASQSQALRGAILSLIDDSSVTDGANPAVWAPFSLVSQ